MICLPVLSFIFFVLFYKNKFPSFGWRVGYILAAVTIGFLTVIFMEIAGLFSLMTASFVRDFWFAMVIFSSGLFGWSGPKRLFKNCARLEFGIFEYVCVAGIALILLINALVAFSYPPNNWDSMTYHLPRVMHWAANANLRFYPTPIDRQLFLQPGAEFFLLHCFLLTGDDRWFNFLQWISFVGCVLSASLLAKILGASIRGQVMTALFVATIPMAILQSTSTQNDLFVSFWIGSFVALGHILQRKFSRIIFYGAAAALGLSMLAKGTFFVVLPFVLYFLVTLWKENLKYIFVCLGIVLVLVAGHHSRIWAWQDGKSFFSSIQSEVSIKRHDPAATTVNAISQIASELMLPWESINEAIERLVQGATVFLGVKEQDQDMFGQLFARPPFPNLVFDEDYAPNPLHMILIFVVIFFLWKLRPKKEVWQYYACTVVSCFLFAVIVKWQPFITRLHLSLFILCSPLVGILLVYCWKWLVKLVIIFLFGMALSTIIFHQTRPLGGINYSSSIPREVYYFMKKPSCYMPYEQAAKAILSSGCRDVGLMQGGDSWEYPLWALTGYGQVRFRSVGPGDAQGLLPCMLVTIDLPQDKNFILGRQTFNLLWQGEPLQVFLSATARGH